MGATNMLASASQVAANFERLGMVAATSDPFAITRNKESPNGLRGVSMNTMRITFPGGAKVAAQFRNHEIVTDQPADRGGEGTAMSPFDVFLASIGTCSGYFIAEFCRARGIPCNELELTQTWTRNAETKLIDRVNLQVHLPPTFPTKYEKALLRAAETCSVHRHLIDPPEVCVTAGYGTGVEVETTTCEGDR